MTPFRWLRATNLYLRLSLGAAILASLVACGGGGGGGAAGVSGGSTTLASGYPFSPASCDVSGQRAWLRDYMNDQYFWFDRQGTANDSASDMAAYLDSLLYKPTDRYSYSQSTSSFTQFFTEGKRTGYGYSLTSPTAGSLIVRFAEPLSPVGLAGLKRGDAIVSIDGQNASNIISFGLPTVSSAGVPRAFTVSNPTDGTRSFSVNSDEYTLSPVLDYRMLTASNGRRVGYLAYNEFISSSASALATAIDHFRANAAQEVILDMRYNGGGSTLVAQNLSHLLGGSALNGQVFAQYLYNSKYPSNTFVQRFGNSSYTAPLAGLSRLMVITSANTASASELLINNLRPYMSVITVGATSFGKPYAFQPRDACSITYNAVNVQTVNALGLGDYANGIPATCSAFDDLTRPFGDPLETRTATALSYIAKGACPLGSSREKTALAPANTTQLATKNIANEAALGEDGKALPSPRGVMLERP